MAGKPKARKKPRQPLGLIFFCVAAAGAAIFLALRSEERMGGGFEEKPRCSENENVVSSDYEIIQTFPHDPTAYTQGLFFADGYLYEGTGLRRQSALRKVNLETGRVLQKVELPSKLFGEGIAVLNNLIYQLTWQSGIGFIYNLENLALQRQFRYSTEGWGLTADGQHLILSDGSSHLYFIDPGSLNLVRQVQVHGPTGPVEQLNELEFIEGYIYANVWYSDNILKISPESGAIIDQYDLSCLLADQRPKDKEAVLNGIAYDSDAKRIFVTGKLWPWLFEIRFKTPHST